MKKLILVLFSIFLFGFGFCQSKTLEVNPAAGDVFTGSDIILSWTVGEGVIETFSNNEMVLTQGFQQPSLKITLVKESDKIDFQLNVYPNPTRDFLTLNFQSENEFNCTAELFDISGKQLYSKILNGRDLTENIDLRNYSSNLYILRIIDSMEKLVRTYKVQKIK